MEPNKPVVPKAVEPAQEMLTIGPTDKSVIILFDPTTNSIKTIAPNIADVYEAMQLLVSALAGLIGQMRQEKASPIVHLPPGARLKG